jgi:hypothetical protein
MVQFRIKFSYYFHDKLNTIFLLLKQSVPLENPEWDHNFVAYGQLSPDRFRKPSENVHLVRKEISQLVHQAIKLPTTSTSSVSPKRPQTRGGNNEQALNEDSIGDSTLMGAISLTTEVPLLQTRNNDDTDSEVNYYDEFEVDEPTAAPVEMVPMPTHLVSKAEQYWHSLVDGTEQLSLRINEKFTNFVLSFS